MYPSAPPPLFCKLGRLPPRNTVSFFHYNTIRPAWQFPDEKSSREAVFLPPPASQSAVGIRIVSPFPIRRMKKHIRTAAVFLIILFLLCSLYPKASAFRCILIKIIHGNTYLIWHRASSWIAYRNITITKGLNRRVRCK